MHHHQQQQQLPKQPTVVSARYADLKVEQTKTVFLEREMQLYAKYVEQKTRAEMLEAENGRLRSELDSMKSRTFSHSDEDRQQLKRAHEQHVHSLNKQNQQLTIQSALVLDALMQHYGQKLLPPHLPPRANTSEVFRIAQESLAKQPCLTQQEWNQRLLTIENSIEANRQQTVRLAIASHLNEKVKVPADGASRLSDLEFAIVDCEKSLSKAEDSTKAETMREMVQLLRTEREILIQGLERGAKQTQIVHVPR